MGVVLISGAVALAATSIGTFAAKESRRSEGEQLGPPGPPRVIEEGVACGNGPVMGLGVSIYRAEERVAASSSDENGDFRSAYRRGSAVPSTS